MRISFPGGTKPCQQICLYYLVSLCGATRIPLDGTFKAYDEVGNERIDLDYCWIPLSLLDDIILYPLEIKKDLLSLPEHIKYFVYRQAAK